MSRTDRPPVARLLLSTQWALLGIYCLLLVLPQSRALPVFRDVVLANLALATPAAAMLYRGWVVRSDRAWTWALGIAVTFFVCGNVVYVSYAQRGVEAPFPSWADPLYLSFYPCAVVAVVLSLRARIGRLRGSVLLDGLAGGLAAASVGALAVRPLTASYEGTVGTVVVAGAYPVCDVVILAMLMGMFFAIGGFGGSFYSYLAGGLLLFAVADTIFGYRVAYGSYVLGTPLDALWAVGVALMAQGVWQPVPAGASRPHVGLSSLWIVGLTSLTALVVLATASQVQLPLVNVVLAIATIAAATVRTMVAFVQVRDLALVRHQAMSDELTGLPNRRALGELVAHALSTREDDRLVGLALIDLDRFKEVNDSLGHHVGDRLLQLVAERLRVELEVLSPASTLARLGGDEFAVLVPGAASTDEVVTVARRLHRALREPVQLYDDIAVHVQSSTGVAMAPDHAVSQQHLMRCADLAMYAGKALGTGVEAFEPAMSLGKQERLRLAEDLHQALRDGSLVVHYQPQVDLRGAVCGAEALVRWEHPERGMLSPDAFLMAAEEHRLMSRLTRIVLATAIRDCADWRRGGHLVGVSVNLSASDLQDDSLPGWVHDTLRTAGLPAAALTLEITETNVMSDPSRAQRTLARLHEEGVQLSVDDYGTGHCSLAYLRRLPVQELKLDRSFIRNVATDPQDEAIVRSTIGLAHSLGMRMVAEGVEDAAAVTLLADAGCDTAQGWYFAPAMPHAAFLVWLNRGCSRTHAELSMA